MYSWRFFLQHKELHNCEILLKSIMSSEGQEKYLRELSITPVGYFTGAIKNHSCACPTGTILHGEDEVFQRNRNDFPKVSLTLDVI
jgi:hypothetical protein